jgi:hypothetical protein
MNDGIAMADHFKIDDGMKGDAKGSSRPSPCLRNFPLETDVNKRYVDITAMIRSLQRTEGVTDCFRRGLADCDRRECSWRQYCVEVPDDTFE